MLRWAEYSYLIFLRKGRNVMMWTVPYQLQPHSMLPLKHVR